MARRAKCRHFPLGRIGFFHITDFEDSESYDATVRAVNEVMSDPVKTRAVVQEIFTSYGLSEQGISDISDSLHRDEERLRNFVIKFHHKKDEPDCNQAWVSALTLGLSYFFGGFIPLMPYFITSDVRVAFNYSVAVMAVTLVVFGYVKTCSVRGFCGRDNIRAGLLGALQMCLIGGLAVGAAVGLVKLINRA
jgi:VIT1/CCC1 family predicted Fe2+/Mn2+ transporter